MVEARTLPGVAGSLRTLSPRVPPRRLQGECRARRAIRDRVGQQRQDRRERLLRAGFLAGPAPREHRSGSGGHRRGRADPHLSRLVLGRPPDERCSTRGRSSPASSAHMAAGADYHGTRSDTEWALTHYVARVRATDAGGGAQRTALAIPIERSGFTPVAPTEAEVPVWLGMWANPADIIPLIKDGKTVHWLVLGGEIVNWSGETVRVAGLHVTVLTPGGTIVADRESTTTSGSSSTADWPAVPPSPTAHAELPDPYTVFVDGIEIPASVDVSAGLTVRLVAELQAARRLVRLGDAHRSRRLAGDAEDARRRCACRLAFRQRHDADRVQPARPLPRALQLRPHAARRHRRDLRPGQDDDNNSFYGYGKHVHAMADGVVLGCYLHGAREPRPAVTSTVATPCELRDPRPRRRARCIRGARATCTSSRTLPTAPATRGSRSRSETRFRRRRHRLRRQQRQRERAAPALRPLGHRSQRPPAPVADALQRPPRRRREARHDRARRRPATTRRSEAADRESASRPG